MRSSRLLSIVLLLQVRGQMTAEALATELEVSPRTIYRDVDDLSAAGIPIYAERGKGGGLRLLDGYRTNLTGLTAEEAGTLLLAGAPEAAAELGLGSLLAAARLKLLAAVPPALRQTATRAEQRFHLDPGGWAHNQARDDRWLQPIAQAVWHDRRLQVAYRRPDGDVVQRELDPLGLVHKAGQWYLVALHDGSPRIYRVDRVQCVQELEQETRRPPAFDLVQTWETLEAGYAAALPVFTARVRLGPLAQRHRDNLGPLAPRGVTDHGRTADGWHEQTLMFDDQRVAVAALLALSPEVEVVTPTRLRNELVSVARQVIEGNDGTLATPQSDLRAYLGTQVTVTVDRPAGSAHPQYPDLRYPINYGYVAGTTGGDGEPIDAYVLGIDKPISTIDGVVIAIVQRINDVEGKLVVAAPGSTFSAAAIRAAIHFQERFFDSHLVVRES